MQKELLFALLLLLPFLSKAQADSSSAMDRLVQLPDKLFESIHHRSEIFHNQLVRSTTKYLSKMRKDELRLQKAMAKTDSVKAKEIFGDVNERYKKLINNLNAQRTGGSADYSSYVDSISTTLKFVQASAPPGLNRKIEASMAQLKTTQSDLDISRSLIDQVKQRQHYLKDRVAGLPIAKSFERYRKTAYYYQSQIKEYRNILNTPGKLESTLFASLKKIPSFKSFFAKHSQLAGLFRLPGSESENVANLDGLQTSDELEKYLQNRFGQRASVENVAHKAEANSSGGLDPRAPKVKLPGSSDPSAQDMPNFKPNTQKTKGFFQRLEFGSNFQSERRANIFPVTTDAGLSIGYKLNDKSVAGIGLSYKIGWGEDWRKISLSHQGIGFRQFIDYKIKGSFWLTGGGELNYLAEFKKLDILRDLNPWQKSVMLGLNKKIKLKKKGANMQVLYDFLHNRHVPMSRPLVFRMGYQLK